MLERRRELIFEGHRLFDLKRLPSSETLNILNNHLASEYVGVPTVQEYQLIYPIPQTEIDVSNGVVTQNPGIIEFKLVSGKQKFQAKFWSITSN
jgi:starch-binding outer membrane protein, SusD/RagB family